MYRDLLTQALDTHEDGPRPDDLLLAELVGLRSRLDATCGAAPVAEALARELSYDGALIRLCASLEVRATPAWFDSPERERARLERELARRGIRLPQFQHASPSVAGPRRPCLGRPSP
jgi:hypothetical protein